MTSTQSQSLSQFIPVCARLPLKALYVITFVFLLLFAPSASSEAVMTVQHTSGTTPDAVSLAVTFNSSVTSGNLILVAESSYDGVSLDTPTDSQGNSFTQLAVTTVGTAGNDVEAIYAATASASGADTVTCNISSVNNIHCHIYELQGVTAVVDQKGSVQETNPSTATPSSLSVSTSAATTNAVDYVLAFFSDNFSAEIDMPGTGWVDTELTDDPSGDTGFTEDQIVLATGVQTATATTFIGDYTIADTYVNLIVALKTSGTATVVTPTLSPAGGTYGSAVTVTIGDTTLGSTIYYTTNGTTPTTSSAVYSSAITVSGAETLEAIATASGYAQSTVASASYTMGVVGSGVPILTVQHNNGSNEDAPSIAVPFNYNVTSGNLILVAVSTFDGQTIEKPIDSQGNSFTRLAIAGVNSSDTAVVAVYGAPVLASGADTVTCRINSTNNIHCHIYEVQGVTETVDRTGNDQLFVYEQVVSTSDATANAIDYVFAFFADNYQASTYTVGPGFGDTEWSNDGGDSAFSEDEVVIATGIQTATASNASGGDVYSLDGYYNIIVALEASGTPTAPLPTFAPPAGSYVSAQLVTISDALAGTKIYYTTDGTTPTTSSALYSSAITVSVAETVKAFATAIGTGFAPSPVASATYSINPAATPTFDPVAGTYPSAQTVTISDTTTGSAIYYTTDGTTPTTNSAVYSSAISVPASETLEAIATAIGYSQSAVGSAAYLIHPAATPTFSPAPGHFALAQTVTISDTTTGSTIYYTTDGTTPTTGSAVYTSAITVSASQMVKAIATATGYATSAVASAFYTIGGPPTVANGVYVIQNLASSLVLDGGGPGTAEGTWVVQDASSGASQQWVVTGLGGGTYSIINAGDGGLSLDDLGDYTSNGSEIDVWVQNGSGGQVWNLTGASAGYFTIASQDIVNAGVNSCIEPSGGSTASGAEIVIATCTNANAEQWEFVAVGPTPAPTFSPLGGTFTTVQTVTISDSISGAAIYYTTNGTTPSVGSTLYSGPISVSTSMTVEAVAIAPGDSLSPVAAAAYTINLPTAATPTFSPVAGTYASPQSVTIVDLTSGASFYYTTNGTTPTTNSTHYTGAITVSDTMQLQAIATAANYLPSAAGSAVYYIGSSPAATPTFLPLAGTYTTVQTVTISDSTTGATIFYTVNGTTPTYPVTGSALQYTGPIEVPATETVQAIASAPGFLNSAVGSAAYTINLPTPTAPAYVQECNAYGGYVETVSCTLNGVGAGHTLLIGIANSTASQSGTLTSSSGTPTLAVTDSSELTAWILPDTSAGSITITYTVGAYTDLWLTVSEYSNTQVSPLDGTGEAVVSSYGTYINTSDFTTTVGPDLLWAYCLGTDGTPTVGATPITWTALAVASGGGVFGEYGVDPAPGPTYGECTWPYGEIVAAALKSPSGLTAAPSPTFSPAAGTYTTIQTVTISDTAAGANMYYTTDGTTPTYPITGSTKLYTGPITVPITLTLNAIVVAPGYAQSQTVSATYIINLPTAAAPTFSPVAGSYSSTQTVTINDSAFDAIIYYTVDGTTPTTSSTVYTGPITVPTTETVSAIAIANNFLPSPTGTAIYTLSGIITATPLITPPATPGESGSNAYRTAQTVTITDATPGATIYYTTDGTIPTTGSTVYTTGPITTVSSGSEEISAFATSIGALQSSVISETYIIGGVGTCSEMSTGLSTNGTANLNGFIPFPSGNLWNTNIANAPIDPNSATILSGLASSSTRAYWGSSPGDGGIPFVIVDSSTQPLASVNVIDSANQSDVVLEPIPNNAPIEGATAPCAGWPDTYLGDAHVLVVDRNKCWLYETWNTNYCNGLWNASSETIWDLNNFNNRPYGWTSADAAGLTIFAGLVRYDEAAAGAVNHAIRFTLQHTKADANDGYFVLPATHAAGTDYGSNNIEGMRMRLNPTFNIAGYSAINKAILTAMQQYGIILADNGNSIAMIGATDSRWNDSDLANLYGIPASDFTVILMNPVFPGWDSATAPTGTAPVINSFTASATSVSSGSPVTFTYNVTDDTYDYIDMLGPVTAGNGSTQTATINPTATQTFMLYSVNQYGDNGSGAGYGVTVSAPITVVVPGSVVVPVTFTPPAGTYSAATAITLNTTTYPYATIYYTTDGTTPTYPPTGTTQEYPVIPQPMSPQSVGHLEDITVSTTETLMAIAIAPGYTSPSAVSSATYTISAVTATPTFSPGAGSYGSALTVTISDSSSSPTIYYTTDGTTPATTSATYTSPITVSSTETIEAIATSSGNSISAVGSATYTISSGTTVATPTFSPAAGTYSSTQTVTISDLTSGATIYYTTDGTTPTTGSAIYSSAITVSATETLEAFATASGYTNSALGSAAYTIGASSSPPIYIQQCSSTYIWGYSASCTLPAAVGAGHTLLIGVYTESGATPTVTSSSGTPVSVFSTMVADYQGAMDAFILADTAAGSITITAATTGGTSTWVSVAEYSNVAISPLDTSADASLVGAWASPTVSTGSFTTTAAGDMLWSMCYGIPSYVSWSAGTAPITWTAVNSYSSGGLIVEDGAAGAAGTYYGQCASTTTNGGALQASIITVAIKPAPVAATPTFSPAAGTYTAAQTVTISDSISGATIYYTTNGTTPTTGSSVYSSAITVSATETLEALATASGYTNSAVGSAAYTIGASSSPPIYVQQCNSTYAWGYTASCTLTGVGAGHTLLIGVYTESGPTPTVTSSSGTPVSIITNLADYSGAMDAYILSNTAAGSITITATTTGTSTWVSVTEYSGVAASPLDTSADTSQIGGWDATSVSTGNFTTTAAGDMLWSMCYGIQEFVSWYAGTVPITWTAVNSYTPNGLFVEDGVAGAAGTYYGQCASTTANGGAVLASIMTVALKPAVLPALYSPTPGSTLPGSGATSSPVTFEWTPGNVAKDYALFVGTLGLGTANLYNSGETGATSATVTDLPSNGEKVYVRLFWLVGGTTWSHVDYTYVAYGTAVAPYLTTPTPPGPLTTTSVAFGWNAGNIATEYSLWIGTTGVGSYNLYDSGPVTVTTETVSGLPSNGETVYARLWGLINGAWQSTDYTYVASGSPVPAALTTPAPNTTTPLTGTSVTFTWTPGNTAKEFEFWVGTLGPGTANLYNSGETGATSATVTDLPSNGEKVYVRLYWLVGGTTWNYANYTYVASGSPTPAALTTPIPGSTLTGTSVTFDWNPGNTATEFQLWVGTLGIGTSNLYNSGETGATTATVTDLPSNGETVYVRLYSLINGVWQYNSYTYTASGSPIPASLTTPTPNTSTPLTGTSVTFDWNPGNRATEFQLWVGTLGIGTSNLYNSGETGATTATVTDLPSNGETVYVRLYSLINGAWQYTNYTYVAYGSPIPASLTTPIPGSTLTGTSVTFSWTPGNIATAFEFRVGTLGPGSANLYNSNETGATSATVTDLPSNGSTVYVRLYWLINGAWQYTNYTYKAK